MACRVEAFFVIINRVEFMDGSLIGGVLMIISWAYLTKHERRIFFDCISGIKSHDSICYIDDSCHKYK